MTKKEFKILTNTKILLLDGATGTNITKYNIYKKKCFEQWIYENQKIIQKLQNKYMMYGSNIIYVPTFSANKINLNNYNLQYNIKQINNKLVNISKKCINKKCYIAGNLTTTGKYNIKYKKVLDIYKEQIEILLNSGVDLLIAETIFSIDEAITIINAASEICELPIMCTLVIESDGSLYFGNNIYEAIEILKEIKVDAVGINCSNSPEQLISIVKNIKKISNNIPIIIKPNAGNPTIDKNGNLNYKMSPKKFAKYMKYIIKAGANIIGGCCGTTPKHIKELYKILYT